MEENEKLNGTVMQEVSGGKIREAVTVVCPQCFTEYVVGLKDPDDGSITIKVNRTRCDICGAEISMDNVG